MGVIMDALNRRSPAEAAQYVLDHMASMVEPIQVIALRHVVERLLAEAAPPNGELGRLHAGCPAWGPGSGYVHISEVEMAALTDERDRLQRDRDNLTIMFNDEVRWRSAANNRAGVLRVRLMQAERVVEALAASLDWVRADACATCAQGICSTHQPAAGVIAATAQPDKESGGD